MNFHIRQLTPTEREIIERGLRFRRKIAAAAATLQGAAPSPTSTPAKIDGVDPSPFWPEMWCWDLVDYHERPSVRPTIAEIMKEAAAYYKISVNDLISERRTLSIVVPRQVAMYLCKVITLRSLMVIGRHFRRDHTTVMHALEKIEAQRHTHPHIKQAVTILLRRLGQS